jgi:hypothetical protein
MSLINNIKIMTDVTGYTCYQEFTYSFPKEWLELYQQEVQEIRSV